MCVCEEQQQLEVARNKQTHAHLNVHTESCYRMAKR